MRILLLISPGLILSPSHTRFADHTQDHLALVRVGSFVDALLWKSMPTPRYTRPRLYLDCSSIIGWRCNPQLCLPYTRALIRQSCIWSPTTLHMFTNPGPSDKFGVRPGKPQVVFGIRMIILEPRMDDVAIRTSSHLTHSATFPAEHPTKLRSDSTVARDFSASTALNISLINASLSSRRRATRRAESRLPMALHESSKGDRRSSARRSMGMASPQGAAEGTERTAGLGCLHVLKGDVSRS